jgi:hypothetical protein
MEALLIDRNILPEPVFSFIGYDRIMAVKQGSVVLFTPATEKDTAELSADSMSIDDICNRHVLSLENFHFDRNEANNYE